jgi:WS/DGAT/MGAT family acyltransferase
VAFTAPSTPFNHRADAQRHLSSANLSLKQIKQIRQAVPGSTVNDVVLAVCSGALHRLLGDLDRLPERSLTALIPVSRRQEESASGGNLVSGMLIELATHVANPIDRLKEIQANTTTGKIFNRAVAMEELMQYLPNWGTALALKAYARLEIPQLLKPIFNLVITNVPGSPVPLYLDDARMTSMEGMAPNGDGMGLTLVVTSYLDNLTISITTGKKDTALSSMLADYLHASLTELTQAVQKSLPEQPGVSASDIRRIKKASPAMTAQQATA